MKGLKNISVNKYCVLSLKVFDLLMDGSELIEKVAQNTNLFRSRMTAAGFHIIVSDCKKNCKYLIYKPWGFSCNCKFSTASCMHDLKQTGKVTNICL